MKARLATATLSIGLLAWMLSGCGGEHCKSNQSLQCVQDEASPDGATYWFDSCGHRESISKVCECGCAVEGSGCAHCVCNPDCDGRVCGSDGCGGQCPPGCTAYETCTADGACVACAPDCAGRVCGSDGCGGQCPPGCGQGEACSPGGECVACTPACTDKTCGSDGCGGTCPPGCSQGEVCNGAGTCEACRPDCAGKQCGPDGCDGTCPPGCAQDQVCTPAGSCFTCSPACEGRACGADGCGGGCGSCDDGLACDPQGICEDVACTGQAPSLQGSLVTAAFSAAFDQVEVSLAHRRDLDPNQDGCLTEIGIELSLADGCRLSLTARDRYLVGQGLEVRAVSLSADGACPGIDPAVQGEYGGVSGLTTATIAPSVIEVPDSNAYSSCLAIGLVISLEGELNRLSDGAALAVGPSRIEIFGEYTSMGRPLAGCPCWSDCRNKQCGDDGCGFDCGVCAGPTDLCDAGFSCVDDCAGRVCGPSPEQGFDCGQCPGAYELCEDGACACPNTVCLGGCCAPDAICLLGECCLPDCQGRQCGDDGCGSTCGTCYGQQSCVNGLCLADPEWVPIEGGTFWMGSPAGQGLANEYPEHEVSVPSFDLLRTEVTVGQFEQCRAAGGCTVVPVGDDRCTFGGQANLPINCLNVFGAEEMCAWLGGRLPTEAEWEFAARSRGLDRIYPWGAAAPSCSLAIWDPTDGAGPSGCGAGGPGPVCSLPGGNTDQGLCDMAGNVAEVVADNLHDDYTGAPADGSAWIEGEMDDPRLARGGHFNDRDAEDLRTRARKPFSYYWYEPFFGVRCARDAR